MRRGFSGSVRPERIRYAPRLFCVNLNACTLKSLDITPSARESARSAFRLTRLP